MFPNENKDSQSDDFKGINPVVYNFNPIEIYTPSRPHPCSCHTIYSFCSASRRLTHNTNLHKHKVLLQHHHSFFVKIEREFNKILVDFFLLYFHFHVLFSSHQILFVFRLREDDNWGGIIM